MFCAFKYKLHTFIFGMKLIFIFIGLVISQNTDPIGCDNTMVSQHRSDKVWKHHYDFCEKKQEKSIVMKKHLWTSKLQANTY